MNLGLYNKYTCCWLVWLFRN